MIVVDASAVVEALRGNPMGRDVLSSSTVFAPHLVDAEVASALRGMTLGGLVSPDEGRRMLGVWPRLGVVRFAMHPLLTRVWELRENLTAHDAVYVALAEELGCSLLTADARVARAAGAACEIDVLPA